MGPLSSADLNVDTLTSFKSLSIRYGISLVLVSVALFVSLVLQSFLPDAFLILFLAAILASGWFGGAGAGLFSVGLSVVAMDYYFIPPHRAFSMRVEEVPYVVSFLVSGIIASLLSAARRVAEEKQKAHLDELFEQAPEAIILVDGKDRVLRINKEFSRIFGYQSTEVLGRFSMDLIVPREHRQQELQSRDRLAHGESVTVETVRARKDASLVHVAEIAVPIVFGGERIAHYMIFRDITESKLAAEALQKAKADLAHLSRVTTMGELAASIAHEVNQPIGAIATNADAGQRWLKQEPPNNKEVGDALERISRDARRAGAVIGRIRALIKKTRTEMSYLDMGEIIQSVLVLTENEMRKADIDLQTDMSAVPLVFGDRVQMQQVMLNLIMNSIDAMNTVRLGRRTLSIRLEQEKDAVLVQVQDSGIGWNPEDEEQIFDAFFSTKPSGMGMGLTISRSIVEAHGGRLWAMPGSPSGAVFSFTLPAERNPS